MTYEDLEAQRIVLIPGTKSDQLTKSTINVDLTGRNRGICPDGKNALCSIAAITLE